MDPSMIVSVGLFIGRLLVGGILVLAGILKLQAGPRWFLRQVLAYELVKGRVAWLLARGLPWVEILFGVLLLVGFFTPLVVVMSFALLWGFTAAVLSTFLRGKSADCGCFGRRTQAITKQMRWTIIYRNLIILGLLTLIYAVGQRPFSVDGWLWPRPFLTDFNLVIGQWLTLIWGCSLLLIIILHWHKQLMPTNAHQSSI